MARTAANPLVGCVGSGRLLGLVDEGLTLLIVWWLP